LLNSIGILIASFEVLLA